jgi:hypothetical protein
MIPQFWPRTLLHLLSSPIGTKRRNPAVQQLGRYRFEADICDQLDLPGKQRQP